MKKLSEFIKKIGGDYEKYKKCWKDRKKGKELEAYTYLETLLVLGVITILAAGATVSSSKILATARKTSAKMQIEQYKAALQTYFLDCGRFPTSEQGLRALWEKPVFYPIPDNWNGPYLDREPGADPWGTDFEYISAESSPLPSEVPKNLPFVLISYAADCKKGGEGKGEDIVSWK